MARTELNLYECAGRRFLVGEISESKFPINLGELTVGKGMERSWNSNRTLTELKNYKIVD